MERNVLVFHGEKIRFCVKDGEVDIFFDATNSMFKLGVVEAMNKSGNDKGLVSNIMIIFGSSAVNEEASLFINVLR